MLSRFDKMFNIRDRPFVFSVWGRGCFSNSLKLDLFSGKVKLFIFYNHKKVFSQMQLGPYACLTISINV